MKRAIFVGLALTALLAAIRLGAAPAAAPVTLADTETRSIESKMVGQKYELFVSLPKDYAKSDRRYPVLYVLDGWHFPLLAFLVENSPYSGAMPPLIVVNISHGDENAMARRERDFTPTRIAASPQSGGAPQFLAFLEQELMPWVDRTYRTNPSDRALLGLSYGGLFAVYTLLHRPQLFQRIVAASPSLGWDKGVLCQEAAKLLPTLPFAGRIDFSYGSEEDGEEAAAQVRPFFEALQRTKPAGMEYRYTVYPGENHNSVRPFSFSSGLAWVYRGWKK